MNQQKTETILIKNKKDLVVRLSVALVAAGVVAILFFEFGFYKQHLETMLVILGILVVFYIDMFFVKKNILREITTSSAEEKSLILDVKEQVMNLDQKKAEFVSLAIHQLRAPLTGIRWALKMIIDGEVGEVTSEQKNMLVKTYEASMKSLTMLNELINIDRVDASKLLYDFKDENIIPIIQSAIDSVSLQAQDNKIILNFNQPQGTLPFVKIDKEKIVTAIENLLENSIKYTIGRGIVTISVKEDSGFLDVSIKDNGIGIPLKDQSNVFKKFFRAHNALEMRMQGSGVGLFMIKNIVEKHGGKCWFESEENVGTTFHVSLPVA
ncbi:MAG: HAMP domain-containing sensor histidine kinase [Candidatus Paceibacterota bacterium]|jgi:signal transduction histidine kinase